MDAIERALGDSTATYAISGSLAARRIAPYAEARLGIVYTTDIDQLREQLKVREAPSRPNLLLIEPRDELPFVRARIEDGLRSAAPSQIYADLIGWSRAEHRGGISGAEFDQSSRAGLAHVTYSTLTIATRSALLDALVALRAHRDALVLVGAQAIYLYTGDSDVAIATETKDSDVVVVPERLGADPTLEAAMVGAGFYLDPLGEQGQWLNDDGIPVELLVPAGLQPGNTRGARIPPHDKRAAKRVPGLEAAAFDHRPMTISAIEPADDRREVMDVAGPAALIVAKMHKIGDRYDHAQAGGRDRTNGRGAGRDLSSCRGFDRRGRRRSRALAHR